MSVNGQSVWRDAFAGLAATAPMTAVMVLGHRRLPWRERRPLPPPQITDAALRSIGAEHLVSESSQRGLSLLNHLAYGTTAGAILGLAIIEPPTLSQGILYGLGVWASGYLGWLPAVGLHRSAVRETLNRNLLMVAAHVVWGASLALTAGKLRELEADSESAV